MFSEAAAHIKQHTILSSYCISLKDPQYDTVLCSEETFFPRIVILPERGNESHCEITIKTKQNKDNQELLFQEHWDTTQRETHIFSSRSPSGIEDTFTLWENPPAPIRLDDAAFRLAQREVGSCGGKDNVIGDELPTIMTEVKKELMWGRDSESQQKKIEKISSCCGFLLL